MDNLHPTIAAGFAERYTALSSKVRELAEPLSGQQFWRKPFPFGNSFGHLVLHQGQTQFDYTMHVGALAAASFFLVIIADLLGLLGGNMVAGWFLGRRRRS